LNGVVLRAPGVLENAELPELVPSGSCIVAIEQVGICGTDVKIAFGSIPVTYPRVLGHEIVGRVEVPGERAALSVGTRVLIDPGITCGLCRACRAGRQNLCTNGGLIGRDADGGLVERLAVDERQLHPIPETVSREESTLLQVLATCVHAQDQVHVMPGDSAVVVGLGVAGLLHLQLLRARGVQPLIGVARSPAKREQALSFGATAVAAPEDAQALVREVTGGDGPSLAVEAVGSVATLAQAIRLTAPGGTVLGFGTITETAASDFPFYGLYLNELQLVNPRHALPRDYDRSIAIAASRTLDLASLWSRSYPLGQAADALEDAKNGPSPFKVSVDVPTSRGSNRRDLTPRSDNPADGEFSAER
jgi:threonine dehydrogenase-like Zn-dependent dehydrogenase